MSGRAGHASMPELLLLCEYPTLNGGERSMLADVRRRCGRPGFAPAVMAPPGGPLAEALAARGVEVLPFRCRAADGPRLPQDRLREQLADVLRRRRPDLLHANSLAMGRLSGPRGRRRCGCPASPTCATSSA